MSPAYIVALVVGGVFALLLLGYASNQHEKHKLERARRRSELNERQMRLASLSDGLPGQYLHARLKQGLHELELQFVQEILKDGPDNKKIRLREEELRSRIAQGDSYQVANAVVGLHGEEQVREVRFQLESLYAQLRRAMQEGLLPADSCQQWLHYLQEQLVNLYLDFFHTAGQNHLQRGLPRQARLVFERAVGLIKRQKNLQPFGERLKAFETLLDKTNRIVMEHDQQATSQASELSESMSEETEDSWKKKQVYD